MRYEDASQTGSSSNELPVARDDTDALAAGARGPATGNVITGDGTQTGTVGADILTTGAQITSIEGAGGSDSDFAGGKLNVTGEFGKLSVDAQGNYSYVANQGAPETARDYFSYRLTDTAGNSDTARLTIEIGKTQAQVATQQVVVGPDGVVVLPAGVTLNDIRVVGRDLVVTLPDGSQMVIVDGAVFVPQLVLDNVEIPATNLAALLIDSEPRPAAGGQPPSSGGNFELPVGPLDPGVPLGDLIPPTELDYTPPDFIEVGVEIINRAPFAAADSINVSEEGLTTGIADTAGNPDTTDSASVSGSILAGDPDGDDLTITLGIPTELLFSNGDPITWALSAGNTVLTGSAGGTTVITITMQDDGDYTVVQSAPVDHPNDAIEDGVSFVIPVNVSDGEDSVNVTITVTVEDDSPSVSNVRVGSSVLLDETDGANPLSSGAPIVATSTDPMIAATINYGADGQGPLPVYGLSLLGGVNSLLSNLQTALGDFPITLTLTSSTLITATYQDGGTKTAFTITMNANGTVTVTQFTALEHLVDGPPGPAHDDALSLNTPALGNLVNATIAYEDFDGDQVTASTGIGGAITFEDDGPSIDIIETIPTDQEGPSPLVLTTFDDGTEGGGSTTDSTTANFAGVYSLGVSDGGADGTAGTPDIGYALNLLVAEGTDSTLDSNGNPIFLYNIGGVVVGSTSATEPASATAASVVFAISVDGDGVVTLTQYQQIDHPLQTAPNAAPFNDQFEVLDSGLVELVATASIVDNDGDTDSDSESIDLGGYVRFGDDGPDISAALVANARIRIDETDGVVAVGGEVDPVGPPNLGTVTVSAATYLSVTNVAVSADSPTTFSYAFAVTDGANSGLLLSTTDAPIYLYVTGNTVTGSTAVAEGGILPGNTVFTAVIDPATGAVTLTQFLAVEHPTPGDSHDEDSSGLLAGALNVTVTATDFDGDTDTAAVDLGSIIRFEDDGPTVDVTANATLEPTITLTTGDAGTEGGGSTSDFTASGNFGGVFGLTFTTGSDGAATPSLTFALGITSAVSGLESHDVAINLYLIGDKVVGSTATDIDDVDAGNTVFDVAVSGTGVVTLTQYQQIDHPLQAAPNAFPFADQLTSLADSLVTLTASSTIIDNDEDTDSDSATVNIGANLRFADDGPVITQGPTLGSSVTLDETDGDEPLSSGAPISATSALPMIGAAVDYGADGEGPDPVFGLSLLGTATIGSSINSGLATADGNHPITLTLTSATLITATYQDGGTQTAFTIQMNLDGTITVTQFTALEHLVDGPPGPAHDDSLDLDNTLGNLVNATVTYQDFDGDTATATVAIGAGIIFKDDGPNAATADVATDILVLDESPVGTETDGDSNPVGRATITANFANNFAAPDYGADGAGSTGYALILTGEDVPSGLFALGLNGNPGAEILLNQGVDGVITGSVGGDDYFTISVDEETGVVTFTQLDNVFHANTGSDDDTSSLSVDEGVLVIEQTVTDADGDTDSASIDLGDGIFQIEDDGPNAAVDGAATLDSIVLDESRPETTDTAGGAAPSGDASATANFADNFAAVINYGTDGAGSTSYSLFLSANGIASGLFALEPGDKVVDGDGYGQGASITLSQNAITGVITGSAGGTDYFTLSINSVTGVVTFTQINPIWHPTLGVSYDEAAVLNTTLATNVQVVQSVTDADGDTDTASINVGRGVFSIQDDGPSATTEAQQDVAEGATINGSFDFDPGVDGGGVTHVNGTALVFGGDGFSQSIPVDDGSIKVKADGTYQFTANSPGSGVTNGTFTVTDGDGDTINANWSFNITDANFPTAGVSAARLDDDGLAGGNPAGGVPEGDIDANVGEIAVVNNNEAIFHGQLTLNFGGDGAGSVTFAEMDGDTGTVGTDDVTYAYSSVGGIGTLTATIDGGDRDGDPLFTLVLTESTGEYTLTLNDNVLHAAGGNEASAPLVPLTYTVIDSDNSPAGGVDGTLNITFNDDAPTVTNVATGVGVTIDETSAVTPAGFPLMAVSASAVITATSAFGADGQAASGATVYAISIVGGGLTALQTAIGNFAISLVQIDAQTIAGQYNNGGVQTAFTVQIGTDGKITVTENVPLEHNTDGPPGPAHDDSLNLSGLINASITIKDGDGDTATGSTGIGNLIVFKDDGPSINVTEGDETTVLLTTQDAETIGVNSDTAVSTANFSSIFGLTSAGGADGAAAPALSYNLAITAAASGLTSNGDPITLFEVNDVIYGVTNGVAPVDANDPDIAFSVSVSATGIVTLTQYQQIDHVLQAAPNAAPFDDQFAILTDGKITLTASSTITDNDGDTATDSEVIDLGGNLRFADDGPAISAALVPLVRIRIDETDNVVAVGGETDGPGGNFGTVTVFPATYLAVTNDHVSADDPTTLSYAFTVTDGANSGLQLSTNNLPVLLYITGNTVTGSTSGSEAGINAGNTVFTAVIDPATGAVTLTQFLAVEHPTGGASSPDEDSIPLTVNALQVTVTATDFDGDTDSASVDLGSIIRFEDDGPSVGAGGTQPNLIVDETLLLTNATQNFAAVFTPLFGSDGPAAANSIVYTLGINAGATGLFDTLTGLQVVLTVNGSGQVVGTAGPGGATVFVVSVAANGDVTLDQQRAVLHDDPLDHDEPHPTSAETLNLDNLVTLTATVTDSDGDTNSATANIGTNLHFEDDGPTFTSSTNVVLDNSATPTGTGTFVYSIGADQHGEFVIDQEISLGSTFTGFVGTAAITNAVVTNGTADADNEVFNIEFDYAPNPDEPGTTVHATGTVTFDKDGSYTVTLDAPIESYSLSSVQNGEAPIFHDRDVNNDGDTTDGVDVDNGVAVVELAEDFFIQFTGASGVTGSAGTFGHDETFGGGTPGEVKISSTAIGVFGNSVQDDDVLDYNFYSSNPGANEDNPPTTSADTAFIQVTQFNGAEDFIVVLKLADPNNPSVFITRTLVIEPGDVITSDVPGYPTLGNGQGLIIIEPNDYINLAGVPDNYEIVGMQLRSSTEGLQAEPNEVYNFDGDLGQFDNTTTVFGPAGGGDQGTNDNDVFKILDIGVVRTTTNVEALTLTFDVTVTDEDGDSFEQTLVVNPPPAPLAATTMDFSKQSADDTSMSMLSFESADTQLQKTAANNNSVVIAAAVAAAGFSAGQAAAYDHAYVGTYDGDSFGAVHGGEASFFTDNVAMDVYQSRTLSGNESRIAVDGGEDDGGSLRFDLQATGQLNGDAPLPVVAPTEVFGGTEASAGDAAATGMIAPMIVMPSADALESIAGNGNGNGGGQRNSVVEKVIAEALEGGAEGGDIDTILTSLGAANSGNAALEALASQGGNAVPAWDMGNPGAFQSDILVKVVAEAMELHHDAVQPAING